MCLHFLIVLQRFTLSFVYTDSVCECVYIHLYIYSYHRKEYLKLIKNHMYYILYYITVKFDMTANIVQTKFSRLPVMQGNWDQDYLGYGKTQIIRSLS